MNRLSFYILINILKFFIIYLQIKEIRIIQNCKIRELKLVLNQGKQLNFVLNSILSSYLVSFKVINLLIKMKIR
jgi:hypothetical protein